MRKNRVLFVVKWFCVFFSVSFMSVACAETKPGEIGRVVGGPCNYKTYPGTAQVVSIEKAYVISQDGKKNADGYDVHFVFHPQITPEQPYARVEGKTHALLLTNGSRPRMGFLKKYGIAAEKTLPCELAVIVKGTCTPIIFKFPTVNLTDYEANR
jgi:hypothetical protein